MRVADYIMQEIAKHVDTVFFVPGGGAMFLVDALAGSGLQAVSCAHEQGAGYAAVGYAQQRGFGVCLVTSGPGATNAVTPCLAAWTDSVPVLFLSGQARSDTLIGDTGLRCRGVQEVDIIPVVGAITKRAVRLYPGSDAGIVAELFASANMDRPGPVWLDVPQDVQAREI